MEEAQGDDDDDVFFYMGGDQQLPDGVRRAKIHKSVKIVRARAFKGRRHLISVEFHDGVEIIEEEAFHGCHSLRSVKLQGVKSIKKRAFSQCYSLTDAEFDDKLETIEQSAFNSTALKNIKIPSVRTIGMQAFYNCVELSDVECGKLLETLQSFAFADCHKLERVAMPLKDDMIGGNHVFGNCSKLISVDLVGGIHKTVASLHLESWRNEMNNEINRINQTLPTIRGKTGEIQQWIRSVIERLDHYKAEHHTLLKEATTLLELALWKANLSDNDGGEGEGVLLACESRKRARKEICVTSGADVVIKNVLPFLILK